MKDKITMATKILLDFMFYVGIIGCLTLPATLKYCGKYYDNFANYYIELCILFFLSGVCAVLILLELRKMFRTVINDDCFTKENVTSLKRMGIYSFAIAFVTSFRIVLYITPAVFVVIIVFFIAGLFSNVLSRVFDKAVTYKLENDLTI